MDKTLVAIFHHGIENEANLQCLKAKFNQCDIFCPDANYYGGKFVQTREYCLAKGYDDLVIICSDITIENTGRTEIDFSPEIGLHGFKLAPDSPKKSYWKWTAMTGEVPFIDGYYIGIRREILEQLPDEVPEKGYGIDIACACICAQLGLKAIMFDNILLSHAAGQSYSEAVAMAEMIEWFNRYPDYNDYYHKILRLNEHNA